MKRDFLNAAPGFVGLAAIGAAFGLVYGVWTGVAAVAFWAPLLLFVALLLIGMAVDHLVKR